MGIDGLPFNAPLREERIAGLLGRLELRDGGRVIDVGCGRGAMLAMLAEQVAVEGLGIDPDEAEIAIARTRDPGPGRLTWQCARVADVTLPTDLDAVLCVGATHAFGPPAEALGNALAALRGVLRDGGRLLVGEGYWRREPSAAYLEATGFKAGDLRSHAENAAAGEAAGLRLLHAEKSSREEWDRFESAFLRDAEERHAASPDDAAAAARLAHWRSWNEAYRAWGRETLGFGFYLFER